MAMTLDRKELLRLARLGAEARLEALDREREAILRSFPGFREDRPPSLRPMTIPSGGVGALCRLRSGRRFRPE